MQGIQKNGQQKSYNLPLYSALSMEKTPWNFFVRALQQNGGAAATMVMQQEREHAGRSNLNLLMLTRT
jgi:hypothetical protein